jgi:hypothetical protein
VQRISKYIKLVEIAVVQIFGSLEDEWCCNTLSFIKKERKKESIDNTSGCCHSNAWSKVLYF